MLVFLFVVEYQFQLASTSNPSPKFDSAALAVPSDVPPTPSTLSYRAGKLTAVLLLPAAATITAPLSYA
jgi:hypothetical protein